MSDQETQAQSLLHAAPAIVEASSEAIATINYDGTINGYNTQFMTLLGAGEGEQVSATTISEDTNLHRYINKSTAVE